MRYKCLICDESYLCDVGHTAKFSDVAFDKLPRRKIIEWLECCPAFVPADMKKRKKKEQEEKIRNEEFHNWRKDQPKDDRCGKDRFIPSELGSCLRLD